MKIFKKIQRKYLSSYVANTLRDLESYLSERNQWTPNPELIRILTKLLSNRNWILIDDLLFINIEKIKIESIFYTMDELELYCEEFIKQTQSFCDHETNRRPKIIIEDEDVSDKEVCIHHFLQVENSEELKMSLARINKLAMRLNEHLGQTTLARQQILLTIIAPTLVVLLIIVEQIYGVIVNEAH